MSKDEAVARRPGVPIRRYAANAGWLTLPIFAWNLVMTSRLPESLSVDVFWRDIPPAIATGEQVFRTFVVALPFLMPLGLRRRSQRLGAALYVIGAGPYVLSWVPLVFRPASDRSTSLVGFLAPSVTPLIWTTGIALVGDSLYLPVPYRPWMYVALSIGFVAFHVAHAAIVSTRGL